jgi:DDE domain/Arm DNA-binding domain
MESGRDRNFDRAVDKFGKTVDSLLCADRSVSAARAFFCKALKTNYPLRPRKLNLDGNAASHLALRLLRQENPDLQSVMIRSRRYLNNIVEQDHRAIKRRCAPMLALKTFRTAAVTLAGVELAHRIRKAQFTLGSAIPSGLSSFEPLWVCALKRRDASALARSGEVQPPMHQNSTVRLLTEHDVRDIKPVRYARKVTVGGGLYLFVSQKAGRTWHYKFHFAGKCRKLTLGTYPEISLECARARHQYARNLLTRGINPCEMKATLGKNAFVLRMREWEFAQNPPTDCSRTRRQWASAPV